MWSYSVVKVKERQNECVVAGFMEVPGCLFPFRGVAAESEEVNVRMSYANASKSLVWKLRL